MQKPEFWFIIIIYLVFTYSTSWQGWSHLELFLRAPSTDRDMDRSSDVALSLVVMARAQSGLESA